MLLERGEPTASSDNFQLFRVFGFKGFGVLGCRVFCAGFGVLGFKGFGVQAYWGVGRE